MIHAEVRIDLTRIIGDTDPMIYGQYLEHLQPEERCIYGAVLDEGSALADARGFRQDVAEAVRELAVPVVRWPGGCFADIYHWEDGIGPVDERPVRRNWHWGGLESNRFGTDEFLTWCELVASTPYINLNFGTGTLNEAVRWLDYCNGTQPTADVRRRQRNGRNVPYNVRLWGVGNEQWGAWEAGHMSGREYAAKLRNWTQFLRKLAPDAQFLGVGSRAAGDPEWDLATLEAAGHLIDYLTLHMYGHCLRDDDSEQEYYAVVSYPLFFETQIGQMQSVIDFALRRANRATPIRIAIDEWNIRHMVRDPATNALMLDRSSPRTLRDALFTAGVLHAMLRNAPYVGMGCYVFLLNGNAVLKVYPDGIVKTPLFEVFRAYRHVLQPRVLDAQVTSAEFLTPVRQGGLDETVTRSAPYVDVVATCNASQSALTLAIINRHYAQPAEVRLDPGRFSCAASATIWEMFDSDPLAANTVHAPERVRWAQRMTAWSGSITVKPHSLALVQLGIEGSLEA